VLENEFQIGQKLLGTFEDDRDRRLSGLRGVGVTSLGLSQLDGSHRRGTAFLREGQRN
jgi:hypothetical protein